MLGEISLSLLCSHSSWGSALDLDPPLHVGRLRASVPCSHRMGLKEQLFWDSGSLRPVGGRGTNVGGACSGRGRRDIAPSLRRSVRSPGEAVPGSWDPGSGELHRLLGGEVWIVTCACTQASWWLQQQP